MRLSSRLSVVAAVATAGLVQLRLIKPDDGGGW